MSEIVAPNTGIKRTYILKNLNCANCAAKIEDTLAKMEDVSQASFTLATQKLQITSTEADEMVLQDRIQATCDAIEDGVEVQLSTSKNVKVASENGEDEANPLIQWGMVSIGAAILLINAFTNYLEGTTGTVIFILSYLFLAWPVIWSAVKNIKSGEVFDENFLMTIATVGAILIGAYPEALGVMLFYQIGEMFQDRATEKSRSAVMDAVDMRPQTVRKIVNQKVSEIPAEQAEVGDEIEILPGDRIPLDGIVLEGKSRIDTAPVTGEPVPVSVGINSTVISGCVNQSGHLVMRVTKPLSESMVSRILDAVENAAATKPRMDRFITRFARIYTPVVVGIALATAIIPSLITGNWEHWIYTALTFLVISCPCALVLSVPLAFFAGIGSGSKKGILFKGGLALEAINKIKVIAFDKTGTLTTGKFTVQKIELGEKTSTENEILSLGASLEQKSTHPIAQSIVAVAHERNISFTQISDIKEWPGEGISGTLAGEVVIAGNRKLMEHFHVVGYPTDSSLYGSEVLLGKGQDYLGRIIIADALKEDAKSSLQKLKNSGLVTAMVTGDTKVRAEYMANEVGVNSVVSELLPEDKFKTLTDLREKFGSIMFVGDGINDAPVLAGADVGVAMGSGADAAIEAADVVIMGSSVSAVADAWHIGNSTIRIAWQNVIFALVVKVLVMIIGFLGFASMWMAVFADTGVTILCILNSIRILYKNFS